MEALAASAPVPNPAQRVGQPAQPAAASPRTRWDSLSILLLAAITIAAAAVRLHALAGRGLWLDESISVYNARHSLHGLLQVIRSHEIYMALYYVFLHFWIALGDSEFLLRLPSVIFSVATVAFTYAIGARLFSRNTGLIAAALLAVNSFHIRYAQEARSYALVILLATVASWLLVRNLQQPEKASWPAYGACLALMIYAHLFALLVVVAHCAALICLGAGNIPWKGLARSAACFAALTLPMAVVAFAIMHQSYPLNWDTASGFSNLLDFFVLTAGNHGILLLVLDAVLIAALIFTAARPLLQSRVRSGASSETWSAIFVLSWFIVPVAVALVAAVLWPPFVPRYLLICLPAFLLAVAAGLTRLRPRSIAWTLAAAIFALNIAAIPSCYHLSGGLDDWRAISSAILTQAQPGDAILFTPSYAQVPFDYYRQGTAPPPAWPRLIGTPVAYEPGSADDLAAQAASAASTSAPPKRIWMVFHHPNPLSLNDRKNIRINLDAWRTNGWTLLQPQEYPMVIVVLLAASSEAKPPNDLPSLFAPPR